MIRTTLRHVKAGLQYDYDKFAICFPTLLGVADQRGRHDTVEARLSKVGGPGTARTATAISAGRSATVSADTPPTSKDDVGVQAVGRRPTAYTDTPTQENPFKIRLQKRQPFFETIFRGAHEVSVF